MSVMQPLKVTVVPVTPIQQNCSIVACTATNRAAIVDPGGDVAEHPQGDRPDARDAGAHLADARTFRSCGRRGTARRGASIPIEGPDERDAFLLSDLEKSGERFGIMDARNVKPDRWLVEGETVSVGDLTFNVLHVPGHTPGIWCS